jgi:hypothetical protein
MHTATALLLRRDRPDAGYTAACQSLQSILKQAFPHTGLSRNLILAYKLFAATADEDPLNAQWRPATFHSTGDWKHGRDPKRLTPGVPPGTLRIQMTSLRSHTLLRRIVLGNLLVAALLCFATWLGVHANYRADMDLGVPSPGTRRAV